MMQVEQTKSLADAMNHLQTLPPTLREEVFHYIDFLRMRMVTKVENKKVKKRHAGTLKGEVVFSDDFDEPLEDFEEYMP